MNFEERTSWQLKEIVKFLDTMSTKKDLVALEDRLRKDLASKKDLVDLEKRMASKDDLKRFATKDDLVASEARTREEILNLENRLEQKMASKNELNTLEIKMDSQFKDVMALLDKTIRRMFNFEEYAYKNMATKDDLRENRNELMSHIDGFAQSQKASSLEFAVIKVRVDRHEDRLVALEGK